MSLSECERFTADLQSNAALRAEAEEARADKSQPLDRMVALAVSRGYNVTAAEAREHLKSRAATKGKVLSDSQLDSVAGGADWSQVLDPGFWGVDLSF